jgi:hypothetical protein
VQRVVNAVSKGNVLQIRVFVAVLAVGLNALSVYLNTGDVVSVQTALQAGISFFTALGTFDLVFAKVNGD